MTYIVSSGALNSTHSLTTITISILEHRINFKYNLAAC